MKYRSPITIIKKQTLTLRQIVAHSACSRLSSEYLSIPAPTGPSHRFSANSSPSTLFNLYITPLSTSSNMVQLRQRTIFNAPEPLQSSKPSNSYTKPIPAPRKPRGKTSAPWQYAADVDSDGNAPFSSVPGREKSRVCCCLPCIAKGYETNSQQTKRYSLTSG